MGMIIDRGQLDQMRCGHEHHEGDDCGPLYFHSNCHPNKPTWAIYENGTLRVECSRCKREIVTVAVAG